MAPPVSYLVLFIPHWPQNTGLNTSVLLPTHSLKEEELESPATSWVVRTFTNVI